jgi:amino-acid N-acetyltransferase
MPQRMPDDLRLVALAPAQLVELRYILKGAGLPFDDIGEPGRRFYRLDDAVGPLGWGGLEVHGSDALLRSVVMLDHHRGKGTGRALVGWLIDEATRLGVERLWLLTTTAAPFFAKLGFDPANRDAAPDAIRATREFRDICPASATCMVRRLRDDA